MGKRIVSHTKLDVYRKAFDIAMQVFELSKAFPPDEKVFPDRPDSAIVAISLRQCG